MRNRGTTEKPSEKQASFDPDTDRYPTAKNALQRIIAEGELPDGPIEWLEVTALASGECTYRIRLPRSEDTEGGYLPPEGSS